MTGLCQGMASAVPQGRLNKLGFSPWEHFAGAKARSSRALHGTTEVMTFTKPSLASLEVAPYTAILKVGSAGPTGSG